MEIEHYLSLQARDRRARQLRSEGYKLRRRSSRNQLLHPMYIEDWHSPVSGKHCGFGNTLYRTHHAVLYVIEYELDY